MTAGLRRWLEALLKINDTPERTALSYSIGVFLSFSPLLGLHTILGLAIAFAFGLNRVAMLLGVYTNTPWTIAPYYALATLLGTIFYDLPEAEPLPRLKIELLTDPAFWAEMAKRWRYLMPTIIGSTILAVIAGLLAYPLSLCMIRAYSRARAMGQPRKADEQASLGS